MNTNNQKPSYSPTARSSLGLAIASLVLGIVGILFSLILVGGLLGLVGIGLGVAHLRARNAPRAMAGWGVALGCIAVIASIGLGTVYYRFYQEFQEMMADFGGGGAELAAWEGVIAPDLVVETIDGEQLRLHDLRGRRVVLNFWATWCGPCVKEIPHFIELAGKTPVEEVLIIGISKEDESTIRKFVEEHGVNYPMGRAVEEDVGSPYADVRAIPTTFFIDRNGVIQSVVQGYQNLNTLRSLALAEEYEGEPKPAPEEPQSGLKEAAVSFEATSKWAMDSSAIGLTSGDWDGDGRDDLLVVEHGRRLRVIDSDGTEKASLALSGDFTQIALGRHGEHGRRLLGYSNWGQQVVAMDGDGEKLWSYRSRWGANGAHWGDLNGDGTDEMIVGMNGSGGLHAVSAEGEQIWRVGGIGNVWNQAIVPATDRHPALVFATEAGGSVRVFDAEGNAVRTIRPLGEYFSQMTAARVHPNGAIQAVAQGETTVGFDEHGHIAWSTPAIRDHGAWRNLSFASGDLTGDGLPEWLFLDIDRTLVVVPPSGEKLASVTPVGQLESFCVLSHPDSPGLLVTLVDGRIEAYSFEAREALQDPVGRASTATEELQ